MYAVWAGGPLHGQVEKLEQTYNDKAIQQFAAGAGYELKSWANSAGEVAEAIFKHGSMNDEDYAEFERRLDERRRAEEWTA